MGRRWYGRVTIAGPPTVSSPVYSGSATNRCPLNRSLDIARHVALLLPMTASSALSEVRCGEKHRSNGSCQNEKDDQQLPNG